MTALALALAAAAAAGAVTVAALAFITGAVYEHWRTDGTRDWQRYARSLEEQIEALTPDRRNVIPMQGRRSS